MGRVVRMVRGVRWRPWSDDTKRLSHDFVVAFFYSNLIDTNSSMLEGGAGRALSYSWSNRRSTTAWLGVGQFHALDARLTPAPHARR